MLQITPPERQEIAFEHDIEPVLKNITGLSVAVFGDFCLDAYWELDPADTERSIETGLSIRRVQSQRYTLGGAGNVVANLIDLGVRRVRVIGMVGHDLFGGELLKLLRDREADVTGMLADESWQTQVYAKPYKADVEDHRIDFGAFSQLSDEAMQRLDEALTHAVETSDVVILNQQIPGGISTPAMIGLINQIIHKHPRTRFIADVRHRAGQYRGAILKLNVGEARAVLAGSVSGTGTESTHSPTELAARLSGQTGQPVFLTRGEHGMVVADGRSACDVHGVQIMDRIDPVGAGDTAVAAIAVALGTGAGPRLAAEFANLAASVTVRKLKVTGTATPDEIRAAAANADYVYRPDLANDARAARYIRGSDIELVSPLSDDLHIRHAIFDHDGTLSTLREGWELIMHPMMVKAILGPDYQTAEKAELERIEAVVSDFISKTTGIQTLVQMQGLVKLIRQFGHVPESQMLDEHGYKRLYNDELLKIVRLRSEKLCSGELESLDFQIKNAAKLLSALHAKGITLYLASGTDQDDVIAEANAMGYGHLFEGRIFGAVGDVKIEAKKMVLERIMRENQLQGHEFVTFGDGPVEMQETCKRGGVCVGVASDEVRRFGLNPQKRTRLIRAGANLIVPDFSQLSQLLQLLNLS